MKSFNRRFEWDDELRKKVLLELYQERNLDLIPRYHKKKEVAEKVLDYYTKWSPFVGLFHKFGNLIAHSGWRPGSILLTYRSLNYHT